MGIIGAIAGAAIFGVIVEVYKIYKKATMIICAMGAIASMFIVYSLYMNYIILACISMIFTGGSLAILAVGIDFAVELSYPVAETVSTGMLMSSGNIVGMILTEVSGVLIQKMGEKGGYISMAILSTTAALSFVVSCFIK